MIWLEKFVDLPSGVGAATEQLPQAYWQIPLSFEANQGQADPHVDFLAHGNDYSLFLSPAEAVLTLQHDSAEDVLRMQVVGGNAAAKGIGRDVQAGVSNYFVGNDPSQWRTNITNYGRVEYDDVYPGVNLVYYGNQRQLEYDFVVAP